MLDQLKINQFLFGGAFRDDELFLALSPLSLAHVEEMRSRIEVASATRVFGAGDDPEAVYVLVSGDAHIVDARERPLRFASRREMIGITEIVCAEPHCFGVRTVTECVFYRIEREEFLSFLRSEPDICFKLLEILGRNLRQIGRIAAAI
jgi:CRP-like cAMP-binding protein